MNTTFSAQALLVSALLGAPAAALAQKMEPSRYWDVGDKATYLWTESYQFSTNVKSEASEWEVLAVDEHEIRMEERRALRRINRSFNRAQRGLHRSICFTVHEECVFSPPTLYGDFPYEPGKRSAIAERVQGETFRSERTGECIAEALEKVHVPAGEFDAYRVSCASKSEVDIIPGRMRRGARLSLREKYAVWYALVNGKPIVIKVEYSSSLPKTIKQELVSVRFK